ncbi:IQ motif and SEC7 domain-containing protein 2-like [Manis pentadactyla]|uniref:IQ motif and SEC7 domain-containing protein 2-like n=1 Tax=Manis pentadactyla TaxID=143292 RepID=UPI00255C3AF4|nr:IQ motif and SEC7 domain-containing protein 2-like [Manis pentadactyla]
MTDRHKNNVWIRALCAERRPNPADSPEADGSDRQKGEPPRVPQPRPACARLVQSAVSFGHHSSSRREVTGLQASCEHALRLRRKGEPWGPLHLLTEVSVGPRGPDSHPPAPPAPALPAPPAPAPLVPDAEAVGLAPGPAQGTRRRRGATLDPPGIFPLRSYGVPILGEEGDPPFQPLQYWPFSSADLYNWKANHPPFSEEPQKLTGLVESLMFSHQPTWDDCQQLLQVLFTTEERERILLEARRNVPGTNGRPSQLPHDIERGFPLTRPNWDFNSPEE